MNYAGSEVQTDFSSHVPEGLVQVYHTSMVESAVQAGAPDWPQKRRELMFSFGLSEAQSTMIETAVMTGGVNSPNLPTFEDLVQAGIDQEVTHG